jgi:hypothetical protein
VLDGTVLTVGTVVTVVPVVLVVRIDTVVASEKGGVIVVGLWIVTILLSPLNQTSITDVILGMFGPSATFATDVTFDQDDRNRRFAPIVLIALIVKRHTSLQTVSFGIGLRFVRKPTSVISGATRRSETIDNRGTNVRFGKIVRKRITVTTRTKVINPPIDKIAQGGISVIMGK